MLGENIKGKREEKLKKKQTKTSVEKQKDKLNRDAETVISINAK